MDFKNTVIVASALASVICAPYTSAAIALDRTRAIYDGGNKSIVLNVTNENKTLPYLAQSWLEDTQGNKISSPIAVLPPIQRIEPGGKGQIKLQGLPEINSLPQDRESVYYFNVREIPPRSNKSNTLQIALQTKIKLFYRPKAIAVKKYAKPWQENVVLSYQGGKVLAKNPTPYFVTLIDAKPSVNGKSIPEFKPIMLSPKGEMELSVSAGNLGPSPTLTYINDYGGRPTISFKCNGPECRVVSSNKK